MILFNLPNVENDKCKRYMSFYISLINKYKNIDSNSLAGKYTEEHHILPRCMGGSDEPDNLIKLPLKAHITAHYLLANIYPENYKLGATLVIFSGNRVKDIQKEFSVRSALKLREAWHEALNSEECRKHRSEIQMGGEKLKLWDKNY